jgi:hypothetical protein
MGGFIVFNVAGFLWLLIHGTSRIIVDHNENGHVSFEKKGPLIGTKPSSVPRSRIKKAFLLPKTRGQLCFVAGLALF